jgi:Fic family protein
MSKRYQPPYTITPTIIRLISDISEQLGRLAVLEDEKNLRLRRINRVRTIQGSLAIEGNRLSEEQVRIRKILSRRLPVTSINPWVLAVRSRPALQSQ